MQPERDIVERSIVRDGEVAAGRPAAFLDRDGVINIDRGFTHELKDLAFTPTAIEAIRLLNRADYRAIVVTNQSGVARGLYGIADIDRFHAHMQTVLASQGAWIDAFYHCPYHPEGIITEFAIEHEDRKPNPGMIIRAMRDWSVPREDSFLIGDRQSDADSAAAAGIPALLIESNTGDLAAAVRKFLAH